MLTVPLLGLRSIGVRRLVRIIVVSTTNYPACRQAMVDTRSVQRDLQTFEGRWTGPEFCVSEQLHAFLVSYSLSKPTKTDMLTDKWIQAYHLCVESGRYGC